MPKTSHSDADSPDRGSLKWPKSRVLELIKEAIDACEEIREALDEIEEDDYDAGVEWLRDARRWQKDVVKHLRKAFSTTRVASEFEATGLPSDPAVDPNLDMEIGAVDLRLALQVDFLSGLRPGASSNNGKTAVFVVHGHDDTLKLDVVKTIGQLGLKAVVLADQPNRGLTIIEKLEHYAPTAGFAVVLLTGDDVGAPRRGAVEDSHRPRARQNVIAELGYFAAKLGRRRVAVLCAAGVEIPSDFSGVVYTAVDHGGAWKLALVKELRAAGYAVDANQLL